jgi:hypothetical protein
MRKLERQIQAERRLLLQDRTPRQSKPIGFDCNHANSPQVSSAPTEAMSSANGGFGYT